MTRLVLLLFGMPSIYLHAPSMQQITFERIVKDVDMKFYPVVLPKHLRKSIHKVSVDGKNEYHKVKSAKNLSSRYSNEILEVSLCYENLKKDRNRKLKIALRKSRTSKEMLHDFQFDGVTIFGQFYQNPKYNGSIRYEKIIDLAEKRLRK